MKIKQEKYQYLHQTIFNTKGDCIEESFYECAVEETINNNFEGWNCTKNCFSSTLIASGALDTKYECEDDEQELCSFYAFFSSKSVFIYKSRMAFIPRVTLISDSRVQSHHHRHHKNAKWPKKAPVGSFL